MMNKILILLFGLLLVSCASMSPNDLEKPPTMSEPAPVIISPPAPPKSAPKAIYNDEILTGVNIVNATNILYKSFLFSNDKLNNKLTTFIYLPNKPITEKDIKQYNTICKIWINSLFTKEEIEPYYNKANENLVPFYWPIKNKPTKYNCEDMIEN